MKPEEFKKLIKEASYVFIVLISDTSVTRPEYFINTVNTTLALKLPAEFEEYKDVFNIK
jgi:HJR/Mrr/RecB family endonuclease